MTEFESRFFKKFEFTPEQIEQYFENALRDLRIAKEDTHPEVKFSYSYNALIKAGIALIAAQGNVKVRSTAGHHIIIIEKIAEILDDDTIMTMGNAMRMKRNDDFYGGGIFISEKDSGEYMEYVAGVLKKIEEIIKS